MSIFRPPGCAAIAAELWVSGSPTMERPMLRALLGIAAGAVLIGTASAADVTLLNVSDDPTRELYRISPRCSRRSSRRTPARRSRSRTANGGSGPQARAVIDGLPADMVTLALAYDIDEIAERGLIARDWQKRLPQNPSSYRRRSCPWCARGSEAHHGLGRPGKATGIKVITPNPKTSGGARWNYLAAWGHALSK